MLYIETQDFGSKRECVWALDEHFKLGMTKEDKKRVAEEFADLENQVALESGAGETLRELRRRGAEVWILSNVSNLMERVPSLLGFGQLVDGIFLSHKEGLVKPGHGAYTALCNKAGRLPSEAYFIGDTWKNDVATPQELGMTGILYDPSGERADFQPRIEDVREVLDLDS